MIRQTVNRIAEIAFKKGLRDIVISPGSRSAPISLAFIRFKGIRTYVVPDERSAGYIALGMSLVTNTPVGLVCTSGTAAVNLFPAVAEAFYQLIPLIIFTADRPPEWIDQAGGQAIHQENLYGPHVKAYFSFPLNDTHDDQWFGERIISEALNLTQMSPSGPVQINLPFREPLYPVEGEQFVFPDDSKIINRTGMEAIIPQKSWKTLADEWARSGKVMILCGQGNPQNDLSSALKEFSFLMNIPVLADILSNIRFDESNLVTLYDLILHRTDQAFLKAHQPDLLITCNLSVLSKTVKLFLRKFKPPFHWHIGEQDRITDTYQSLTRQVPVSPAYFFRNSQDFFGEFVKETSYLNEWTASQQQAKKKVSAFFPSMPFSELEAVGIVLKHLPEQVILHLANSMPVRLAGSYGISGSEREVYANRGTSGIDGCSSTAVGAALKSDKLNVLITGDMAFFYDRNAFWHSYRPENLRIVILNNHGGGIFRMINGPSTRPELEEFFETKQQLTAANTAKDFNMEYTMVKDSKTLNDRLKSFFEVDGSIKIMEIETDGKSNKSIFNLFINQFK